MNLTYESALEESIKYFNGDELAGKVFLDKYSLKDNDGKLLEKTPEDMHRRIAKEFARIEKAKFKEPLTEDEIFSYLDKFKYIVPQGSPMYGIGNNHQLVSLSNCFLLDIPLDNYSSILQVDEQLVNVCKRRGGVGIDISNLRPAGTPTKNAARSATGIASFMERYSNSIREVGQCVAKGEGVLTKRGIIPIQDVIPNQDFAWTKAGWAKIINLFKNGKKEIYKVISKSGFEIKTSIDHIYQSFDNGGNLIEKHLKDLRVRDNIVLCLGNGAENDYQKLKTSDYYNTNNKPINCVYPPILNEKLAYILGYSYGDGYVESNEFGATMLEFACSDDYPEVKEKLKTYVMGVFGYEPATTKGDGRLENISIHNKAIVQFLLSNSLLKGKAGNLVFPQLITNSPVSVQCAFLAGYFDADGYASGGKKGYCFTSINKEFLRKTQTLLLSLGVVSKLYEEDRLKFGWNNLFTLSVVGKTAQERFLNLFTESEKVNLVKHVSKRDCWLTPFKAKTFNIKYNNYSFCPDNAQFLSLGCAKQLKEYGESILDTLLQDEIISVESAGTEETFDLELESEYLFWCEGFYIHNSGRRGALMLTMSVHHPEVLVFATIKNDDKKVTGANISLRLTKEFISAVKEDREYELRWPVDAREKGEEPKYSKMVSAKEVWKTIIHSAWLRAEPGLLMWDNVTENTPADYYEEYKSRGTNPCCHAKSKPVYVKTNNGLKEIQTVSSKDLVYVTDAFTEKWAVTSGYFSAGVADVYEVVFSNKQVLYVTLNHKFAVHGGYGIVFDLTPLALLKAGDEVLDENADFVKIESINYYSREEVGCINVPDYGFFVTDGGVISGNSEINLSPLDSCRLLLLNLLSYVKNPFTKNAVFDFDLFYKHSKIAQRLMDNLVDLESEKITAIINKVKADPEPEAVKRNEIELWTKIKRFNDEGRRTGTGITALADTLAALGIGYGTEESIKITEDIYRALKLACYESSVDMAEELGAFKVWDHEKEKNCPFLLRIKEEDAKLYNRMKKVGRRNIALLTTAPAGSCSILTGTSSGIEPVFMLTYTRRKKVNPNDRNTKTDFVDHMGDCWQEFVVYHPTIAKWMEITGETDVTKSPWHGHCAEDINWVSRVNLQAALQRHVCHSLSSTINLPNDVKEEKIAEIYETAFDSGCKGITVYRKGCRTGVLIETNKNENLLEIPKTRAPKRPKELPAEIFTLKYKKEDLYVAVGFLGKDVYEVFVGFNPKHVVSHAKGKIIKNGRGKYNFVSEEKEYHLTNGTNDDNSDALCRMISAGLRHGCDLKWLIGQLEKTEGDLTTFAKVICRVLKKFVKDGTISAEKCPECGNQMIFTDGCCKCSCGYGKCS